MSSNQKEYIERESAVQALNSEGITKNMRAHRKLLAIPAADVAAVRHGYWKRNGNQRICSQCAYAYYNLLDKDYDYCPHCGAKMDGKG